MNPKDKRPSRPADGDEGAPLGGGGSPPALWPRDEDMEPLAVKAEDAKSGAAARPHPVATAVESPAAASPAVANPAAASLWSPSDYPGLVFSWSVIRTDDPAVLMFPTKVNLDTAGKPGGSTPDPRSVLVDATLSSDRKQVTFSVAEESGLPPFLWGTLNYEPGAVTASLTVTNLKYPGGAIPRQVLYP